MPWRAAGGYDEARAWALAVAGRVADALPDVATTNIRKAKRGGRVYLDVLQNARGHNAVPPYVLRPVPGALVSTPFRRAELKPDLDQRHIPYPDHDVTRDTVAQAELQRMKAAGVPVTRVGEDTIIGFDQDRLTAALEAHGVAGSPA